MSAVIISGASGQLGKAFVSRLDANEYAVHAFDHAMLDISDQDRIQRVLNDESQVKFWINCAAYTKVDDAEKNEETAKRYNALAPGYLAQACKAADIHLIHFSTDYVYHNALRRPLKEDDPTEPKSVYAKTKWEGETAIMNSGASHTIIRTSWVYGPGGHNFVNTMLRLGKTHQELKIVADQVGAPTYTFDIADAVKEIIQLIDEEEITRVQGIFNYANGGEVTWADFARTIFKYANLHCVVQDITTEEYGAAAPRPAYSVLNCDKISELLSDPIPHWEDALKRFLLT